MGIDRAEHHLGHPVPVSLGYYPLPYFDRSELTRLQRVPDLAQETLDPVQVST